MNDSTIIQTLNRYKIFIGIGIGVAIGIGAGLAFFLKTQSQRDIVAWQSLLEVNNELSLAAQRAGNSEEKTAALTTAANAYTYIKENISSSSAMPWVLFQLGNIYYTLGNYDEAIREYTAFLNKYSGHPLTPFIKQSLGYTYEEKGLFFDAIKQFEGISMNEADLPPAQIKWDTGRCYEKLGESNKAIYSYTETIELSPDSLWARMAQYRLSVIQ